MFAVMSAAELHNRLDPIATRLRETRTVTPDLLSDVIAGACVRLGTPQCAEQAARVKTLVAAQAWIDAAIAIIEAERWIVRRIAHDDGEWHCSLGRRWQLPQWLDDRAEGSHEMLPLALLSAFIATQRCTHTAEATPRTVPHVSPAYRTFCCDNFA
jgi:hypothetical protein